MGKIVKYCAACEESFAEKFAFCPNCGNAMQAFEMNPLNNAVKAEEVAPVALKNDDAVVQTSLPESPRQTSPIVEPAIAAADTMAFTTAGQTKSFADEINLKSDDVESKMFDPQKIERPETAHLLEQPALEDSAAKDSDQEIETLVGAKANSEETETVIPAKAAAAGANGNGNYYQTNTYQPSVNKNIPADNGFHVTVIQEKNAKQRNGLLLGALVLMLALTAGGMVYSIFNHPLFIGAIGDDDLMAFVPVVDEVPMEVEDPPKPKADKDSGGGGGGGREEETQTSKGRLATQMREEPLITPTKTIPQKTDFDLKMTATTVGDKKIKPTEEPYGDPNARYGLKPSDGTGKGEGQGSGTGRGQGSGNGLGQGSGNGSGSGGGNGNGNGNGNGDGNTIAGTPPPPPARPVGVTEKIKFISKPKASYTDQARTNQIQGTVRLRVTFSASGQIGSIAPVSGLPYGLTEQAIAAARQIRFEPAKKNGVPIPTTAVVEYNFNIY